MYEYMLFFTWGCYLEFLLRSTLQAWWQTFLGTITYQVVDFTLHVACNLSLLSLSSPLSLPLSSSLYLSRSLSLSQFLSLRCALYLNSNPSLSPFLSISTCLYL